MEFIIGLNVVAILMQLVIVYYGYVLFKMVRPLKFWTRAWGLFTISMVLVALRRIWSLFEIVGRGCPDDLLYRYLLEVILLIVISGLWMFFTCKLEHLFKKYLNGEGVLLEREQVVESREKIAKDREDVVGRREVAVQEREDGQKHSGYYKKSWK